MLVGLVLVHVQLIYGEYAKEAAVNTQIYRSLHDENKLSNVGLVHPYQDTSEK